MSMLSKFWHTTLKQPFRLHKVYDQGDGEIVVLIHGLAAESKTWKPLVDIIDSKRWHVVAYDLLGFGKSPKPDYMDYNVEQHAAAILKSLGRYKRRKLTIVGHSMGCLIASHIAYTHPALVNHLVLYEPPLYADSPEFRSHARRKQFYFALYEYLSSRPSILMRTSKLYAVLKRGDSIVLRDDTVMAFRHSMRNTILKQKAYRELGKITVPTDIIYGTFDFVITRASVKKMLQHNKNITFHLVNQPHDITKRAARYIYQLL